MNNITKETPNNHHILKNSYLFINKINNMSKRLTTSEFIEKAKIIHGNRYDYSLVNYINNYTKVKIICSVHGIYEQLPNNHTSKKCGCLKCSGHGKTTEEFIQKCKSIHGDKYEYTKTIFKSVDDKIIITCKNHGDFKQIAYSHTNGSGCSKCRSEFMSLKLRKSIEKFIEQANKIHNHKYDYSLSTYIKGNEKIIIICPNHGEFKQIPESHLFGRGCPKCNESHGERKIRQWLENKNIKYEFQKKFSDCTNKTNNRKLPFDFYLKEYNLCIEYNGKQHYSIDNGYFGANKEKSKILFKNLKNNDNIKCQYCKKNNINFLVIKFNENIENKLNQTIATISLKK